MILDTIRRKEYDNAKERLWSALKGLLVALTLFITFWIVIVIAFTW